MTNRSWDKSNDNASMKHLDEFAALFLNIFHSHRLEHGPGVPISTLSLDDAYAVQRKVIDQRVFQGEQVAGFKVGCTSRAIRHQFGLSEPICGRVMQPHLYFGNTALSSQRFHLPAVEPELVFMIGRDFVDEVGPEEPLDNSIDFVSPGIEGDFSLDATSFWHLTILGLRRDLDSRPGNAWSSWSLNSGAG